jgi:hypothetical protein
MTSAGSRAQALFACLLIAATGQSCSTRDAIRVELRTPGHAVIQGRHVTAAEVEVWLKRHYQRHGESQVVISSDTDVRVSALHEIVSACSVSGHREIWVVERDTARRARYPVEPLLLSEDSDGTKILPSHVLLFVDVETNGVTFATREGRRTAPTSVLAQPDATLGAADQRARRSDVALRFGEGTDVGLLVDTLSRIATWGRGVRIVDGAVGRDVRWGSDDETGRAVYSPPTARP